MSELTPTQKATALDRLASRRAGFTGLGDGYSFGIISRPENPKDLTPEQRREQTVWGITAWDEDKLGPQPATEEIETEAVKEPVPQQITRRQFHLAALSLGITRESIIEAINSIEDEQQRAVALIDYKEAIVFERTWPMLEQMVAAMGLTPEQVDDAFRQGAKL